MHRHIDLAPIAAWGAFLVGGLDEPWIRELLPKRLLLQGPLGLLWWQWLALAVVALLAMAVGGLLGGLSRIILRAVVRRTAALKDSRLLVEIAPAITAVWTVLVAEALLPWVALRPAAHGVVTALLAVVFIFAVSWGLWRATAVLKDLLLSQRRAARDHSVRALLGVGIGIMRAVIVALALLAAAARFGYSLTTALAGLGIGGIALALGAQKLIENLLGSLALGLDQPFYVDDLVTVDGVTGTVERVGMRSTRIRTPDRTLVTIPNGKLADMRIESLAARDRLRLAVTLRLTPSTTIAQTRQVIDGVSRVLKSHPHVAPDHVVVALAALSPASWDIEIVAWCDTVDDATFRSMRQDVLLAFADVVREAGTNLAWQSRTVQLVTESLETEHPESVRVGQES